MLNKKSITILGLSLILSSGLLFAQEQPPQDSHGFDQPQDNGPPPFLGHGPERFNHPHHGHGFFKPLDYKLFLYQDGNLVFQKDTHFDPQNINSSFKLSTDSDNSKSDQEISLVQLAPEKLVIFWKIHNFNVVDPFGKYDDISKLSSFTFLKNTESDSLNALKHLDVGKSDTLTTNIYLSSVSNNNKITRYNLVIQRVK